jgi:recombination protein RecT
MNALVPIEKQLTLLAPNFAQVLPKHLPAERLIRTVVVSCERLPALLDCDRQSIFSAAMSAAVLGLEVDGVTGQAYLIPFKGRAQLVIGYKGFNTLAARSGITISGGVVREGDEFEFELGSAAFVRHRPKLGSKGRLIAAYATATAKDRPPVVTVLDIDELNAVKGRSPGAKRSDSPWNDSIIGFPAMCEKTAKRRLARAMPLNVMQLAARMDEAFDEQGHPAHIDPDRNVVIEGEVIAPRHSANQPSAQELISPRPARDPASAAAPGPAPEHDAQAGAADDIPTAAAYFDQWETMISAATSADQVRATWNDQTALRKSIAWTDEHTFNGLQAKVKRAIDFLSRAPA